MSKKAKKPWYRLDNAGVLYSATLREKYAAVYRLSAVMDAPVDPGALQRAIDLTLPRFPGFRVKMRRGMFWNYFEPNDSPGPFVRRDMANPCQPVRFKEDDGWLIRVFHYEHRVSLEVFHAVSDGVGSLTFFRTLLAVYLRQLGHQIPNSGGVLDIAEPPRPEELEDAYGRCAGKRVLRGGLARKAFSNTSFPEAFYTLNVTMGFLLVDQVRAAAKRWGASITEYLAAVLMKALLDNQAARRPHRLRPVALAIPINLRAVFPSETLRNFMITVRPEVDPGLGDYTFSELVTMIHHYMRLHMDRHQLQARITGNVAFTANPLLQVIPNVIKRPVMSWSYHLAAVRPYSATFTNPGAFAVPDEMAPHIRRMEAILGQATRPSPHCTSISFGNTLCVTFAGTGVSSETERRFFTHLVRDGIHVKVESNRAG